MMNKNVLTILVSLLLTSCVAPITHTFFVPNSNDGEINRSSSCGFLSNNENTLKREFGNFTISVTPQYLSDGKLAVNFFMRNPTRNISFNGEKVRTIETTKDLKLIPESIKETDYGPGNTHPYTLIVTLIFSEKMSEIRSIKIVPMEGVLMINGKEVLLKPFRFEQKTSKDLYYASINC